MDKVFKQMPWVVKVLDKEKRIIEMVGSTEDVDRAGDKMSVGGAKLENYLKNPVILANHNYGYGIESPVIGKALSVTIQGKSLVFKIQFAETDNAKEWFYLYSEGYMNASSIGFIPLERKPNDKGGYDFTSWELLELSLVTVPCNPNAVQRAFDEGLISKGLFDQCNIPPADSENSGGGTKKSKGDEEELTEEQIKALIDSAVKGIELPKPEDHSEEIKGLQGTIAELKTQLDEVTTAKAGASLSSKNKEIIKAVCTSMDEHVKALKAMLGATEPDGDEEKEFSEDQLQKVVQERIAELLKGAGK